MLPLYQIFNKKLHHLLLVKSACMYATPGQTNCHEGTKSTELNDFLLFKIAVQGCCHGEIHKIYRNLVNLEEKQNVKVDLLIICGDFQAIRDKKDLECMACPPKYRHMGDFKDYYDGTSIAPVPTIFIGGNHEASNYLQGLYYGGWVCPNMYYLGHSGVVNFGGLRIAGISGIFYPRDFRTGYYEKDPFTQDMIRSAYHYREFEIKKLMKIEEPVDIFLSHEWPTGIYNHGNINELLRKKPYFRDEVAKNHLGSKPLSDLMDKLKPKNWYSAHLHVGFDATKMYPDGSNTQFMALDKCIPNRDYMRIIDVPISGGVKEYSPKIKYDAEWLAILKESEPFMNYSRGHWNIPIKFYEKNQGFRKEIVSRLTEDVIVIESPKNFNGSEINQTKILRSKFLIDTSEHCSVETNPEEIELDL